VPEHGEVEEEHREREHGDGGADDAGPVGVVGVWGGDVVDVGAHHFCPAVCNVTTEVGIHACFLSFLERKMILVCLKPCCPCMHI